MLAQPRRRWANINPTPCQRLGFVASHPANWRRSTNAVPMLGHRLRNCTSIAPALIEYSVSDVIEFHVLSVRQWRRIPYSLRSGEELLIASEQIVFHYGRPTVMTYPLWEEILWSPFSNGPSYDDVIQCPHSKCETFTQCCFIVVPSSPRWPNVEPTLGERLVFVGCLIVHAHYSTELLCFVPSFWGLHSIRRASKSPLKTCFVPIPQCPPNKHETSTQCWANVGPPSTTLAQHWSSIGSMSRVYWFAWITQLQCYYYLTHYIGHHIMVLL